MHLVTSKYAKSTWGIPLLFGAPFTEFSSFTGLEQNQTAERKTLSVEWFFPVLFPVADALQIFGIEINAEALRNVCPITRRHTSGNQIGNRTADY